MKKKTKYTDEPIGRVKVIPDFLPSPEELALKDEIVKVTIALSKSSVDFFKKEAKKYNTQYQKMIRRLLDEYAAHQELHIYNIRLDNIRGKTHPRKCQPGRSTKSKMME